MLCGVVPGISNCKLVAFDLSFMTYLRFDYICGSVIFQHSILSVTMGTHNGLISPYCRHAWRLLRSRFDLPSNSGSFTTDDVCFYYIVGVYISPYTYHAYSVILRHSSM